MANIAKDLAQIISQSNSKKTGPYDTPAEVKRIEGNTVWVSIPGGIDETPIEKTVNCSVGDNVQIRVGKYAEISHKSIINKSHIR